MTAINNLEGNIKGVDGKETYREQIADGLFFCVFVAYSRRYAGGNKENWDNSSYCKIEAVITDGTMHTWSNGVRSYNGEEDYGAIGPLRSYKTKDGFPVQEVQLKHSRKWIVEVPLVDLTAYAHG